MPETTPQSIWARPHRGTRGPRPEHTRAEIASAAIALADSGGLPAASMRAVATALGTKAGSLYRYVSSRDDLLDLMVDAAVAELRLDATPGENWQDDLVALAREQLALYRRHPWLRQASLRPAALGPRGMDYFEYCLKIMAPLPCGATVKMETIAMITGVAFLFASRGSSARDDRVSTAELFGAATPDSHPHLIAALTQSGPPPPAPTDLFDRVIRSVLRGLLAEN